MKFLVTHFFRAVCSTTLNPFIRLNNLFLKTRICGYFGGLEWCKYRNYRSNVEFIPNNRAVSVEQFALFVGSSALAWPSLA
jgi:hypothetical protein